MDYISDNPTPDRFFGGSGDNRNLNFSWVTHLWLNVVNSVDSSKIANNFSPEHRGYEI